VVADGYTICVPLVATLPMPPILAPAAFVVLHASTAELPALTLEGAAVNDVINGLPAAGGVAMPSVAPTVSSAVALVEPYLLLAVST
jgi:hypothetical protein